MNPRNIRGQGGDRRPKTTKAWTPGRPLASARLQRRPQWEAQSADESERAGRRSVVDKRPLHMTSSGIVSSRVSACGGARRREGGRCDSRAFSSDISTAPRLGIRRPVNRVASASSSAQRAAAGTYLPPTAPGDGIRGLTMRWAITPTPNFFWRHPQRKPRGPSQARSKTTGGDVCLTGSPRVRRLISHIRRLRR